MHTFFRYTKPPEPSSGPNPRQSMTNNIHRTKATHVRGHVIAASLIGAASFLSCAAHADTAPAPVAQASAPPVATQPGLAATDPSLPAKPQVFETAPTIQKSILTTPAASDAAPASARMAAASGSSGAGAATSATDDKDNVPWALDIATRPGLLNYAALIPLNGLYFTLPTEKEARIMLPGNSADAANQARYVVQRYVTDNIGSAAQIRARQLEAVTNWVDQTSQQKKLLPKDPWAAYEFNREALSTLENFKAKIDGQSEPTIKQMTSQVQAAVSQLAPVMEATGGYEQKMLWYNVLVQLKDGINLYQSRVAESDRSIQDVIAGFERDNPPVARPQGDPPPSPNVGDGPLARRPVVAAKPSLTPDTPRELAQPIAPKQDSGSSSGGIVVVLGMLAVAIGLFLKLRKRVSNKGAKPENQS